VHPRCSATTLRFGGTGARPSGHLRLGVTIFRRSTVPILWVNGPSQRPHTGTLKAAEPRRALQRTLEGGPRRPQGGDSAWLFPVTNLKPRSKDGRGGLKEVIPLGFSQLQTSNLVNSQLQTQLLTSYKPSYKPTVTQLGTFEQY